MNRIAFTLLILLASAAGAESPQPDQFARGVTVLPQSAQPVVQLAVPDEVYRTVTRDHLADVRVFDGSGKVIPHALCAAPEREPPVVSTVDLPIVAIQVAKAAREGTQVEVETEGGARIAVRESDDGTPVAVSTEAHVIDATGIADELRAIELDWQPTDGASEARVRIDASDDLDRWQTVVNATTLVRAGNAEQLRRERIELPQARYHYLRIERVDRGRPIAIQSVHAEQIAPGAEIEPQWFTPPQKTTDEGRTAELDRRVPIRYARLKLPYQNMTTRATLRSRADAKSPWIVRWSGEAYSVVADGVHRASRPATLDDVTDREWQLQLNGGTADLDFELGYRPALVRFMAQGEGPFTLAFGSRQAEPATALGCEDLLSNVDAKALREMTADAIASPSRSLGGEDALRPLPKKTPLRLIVLWSALIVGVALLVTMALSLMKRVR